MKKLVPALVLALALPLVACGGDDPEPANPQGGEKIAVEAEAEAEAEMESALKNAATAEEAYFTEELTYTSSVNDLEVNLGLDIPVDVTLVVPVADGSGYCIEANHAYLSGVTFHLDSSAVEVVEGTC